MDNIYRIVKYIGILLTVIRLSSDSLFDFSSSSKTKIKSRNQMFTVYATLLCNVPTSQSVMASDATSAPLVARWALSGQLLGSCNTVDELKQKISQQLGVSSDLKADDLMTHGLLKLNG